MNVPVAAAYSVSGEYAMVKAAAKMGWIDEKSGSLEKWRWELIVQVPRFISPIMQKLCKNDGGRENRMMTKSEELLRER